MASRRLNERSLDNRNRNECPWSTVPGLLFTSRRHMVFVLLSNQLSISSSILSVALNPGNMSFSAASEVPSSGDKIVQEPVYVLVTAVH